MLARLPVYEMQDDAASKDAMPISGESQPKKWIVDSVYAGMVGNNLAVACEQLVKLLAIAYSFALTSHLISAFSDPFPCIST